MSAPQTTQASENPRLRLDKWLWYARVVKTRTLAQKLVASGVVRVDSIRITGPDYKIAPGMVLTMTVQERIRIFKIVALGKSRRPASEAALLYEDLSPPVLPREKTLPGIDRPKGAGRPTKRERRETDAFIARSRD